jgi:hypothetical protein
MIPKGIYFGLWGDLWELMIPKGIFYYEQILVVRQFSNCSSHVAIVEFAFNSLGHHQHLFTNNNNNSFANLYAGCSPPTNSFWPLGHPIPSPHFNMKQEELEFNCSIIPTFFVTRKHWRIWSHLHHWKRRTPKAELWSKWQGQQALEEQQQGSWIIIIMAWHYNSKKCKLCNTFGKSCVDVISCWVK